LKFTNHFTIEELTFSEVAARNGLNNQPDAEAIGSLRQLCLTCLEPLRDLIMQPIIVTSGFRSPKVNQWVGGSKNSDHLRGNAADIVCPEIAQPDLFCIIRSTNLPFHQLIDEFGAWVHIAFRPGEPIRRQTLRAIKREKAGVDYVAV
jgi:zinc D-Ala-D-Ala carboxypeptidase